MISAKSWRIVGVYLCLPILTLGAVVGLVPATPAQAAVSYYLPYPAGKTYTVTQGPGGSTSHGSGGNSAHAIDFNLTSNDDIAASAPGTLYGKLSNHATFGRVVYIKHSDGKCTIYAHMSSWSTAISNMSDGGTITQGLVLGKAGETGYADGVHLHFGRAECASKQTINVDFVEVASPVQGQSYTSQNVASPSGHQALTESLVLNGEIHNFYYDATNGNLRHAWKNSSGTWNFQNLDGDPGSIAGHDANVGNVVDGVVLNGEIHLFYRDITYENLRYAKRSTSGAWSFLNLDGDPGSIGGQTGNMGQSIKALVYGNGLQLFYSNKTNGTLRHAWKGSGNWNFENLDGDSGSVAGTKGNYGQKLGGVISGVIHNSQIQLFYYDAQNGNLRRAWTNSNGWNFQNLDGDSGSILGQNADVGRTSLALSLNGRVEVFYTNTSNGTLRRAWTVPGGWTAYNLDGDSGSIAGTKGNYGQNVGDSMAGYTDGTYIQLFYYDAQNGNLRHAWTISGDWNFENLDGDTGAVSGQEGNVGKFVNVLNVSGQLEVFYYDATQTNLRRAWAGSSGWNFYNLDGDSGSISGYNADVY